MDEARSVQQPRDRRSRTDLHAAVPKRVGDQSAELQKKAREEFEIGVKARETGDTYVRLTVFLATVLLLTALSQRFRMKVPRIALLVLAGGMLAVCTYWLVSFPRVGV